jgi:hypothetical protein
VTILVDLYLLLGVCLVDRLDVVVFRVGHVGIWPIRVAIGLLNGTRRSVSFFEVLSVVPGNVNIE